MGVGENNLPSFHVVLFRPEIPSNTGNIGRLCVGMGANLHIIKPMRFLITDKYLKRAGLDYWEKLNPLFHESFEDFLSKFPVDRIFLCTTKSTKAYTSFDYRQGDVFVFGPETSGIPEDILAEHRERNIRIPMTDDIRSINLSNSVAVILYEAWRQIGFAGGFPQE